MAASGIDKVHERVYRVPAPFEGGGLVNLYVIRGERTAVVDSGVLGTPTNHLEPALRSVGLALSDVDLVLNTHGHMDHLGGNAELKDAGADIALHREDRALADSKRRAVEKAAEGLRAIGLERMISGREAFLLRLLGREVGVDRVLEDGDIVDLGADVRLQVVHSPGHTRGSVCYWWEATGLLITGDSSQARGSRLGGLPVLEEPTAYPASLRRAEAIGARTLLMGHAFKGPSGDLGPVASEGRVADIFRESHRVHEALAGAFEQIRAEAPGASGGEVARGVVDRLREPFGLLDEQDSGLPAAGMMTLPSYLRAGGA
ncbi:MAG: MBL fold metallo-hydrolase [Candidatus Limnocylindrales bacterium]